VGPIALTASPGGTAIAMKSGLNLEADRLARRVASDPTRDLWESRFSADGRWIVFFGRLARSVTVSHLAMPATGGPWIPVTDGKQHDDKPRWSPGGKTIY
jgi:WD40-like Beta Propeller Repeat